MKRLILMLLVLSAACGGAEKSIAPPPPPPPPVQLEDPPAMVHAINQTSDIFVAWVLVIGHDVDHSAIAPQALVNPTKGPYCLFSGSIPGDRRFVYAAVVPSSALDKRLIDLSSSATASVAFRDSLSKNQINISDFLAANPGLIANTPVFDPAPLGYSPADTVPWRWTVTAPSANTIAVDSSDHTCTRKL